MFLDYFDIFQYNYELNDEITFLQYKGICKYIDDFDKCKFAWYYQTNNTPALGYESPDYIYNAFKVLIDFIELKYNSIGFYLGFYINYHFYYLHPFFNFEPFYNLNSPLKFDVFINNLNKLEKDFQIEEIKYGWNSLFIIDDLQIDPSLSNLNFKTNLYANPSGNENWSFKSTKTFDVLTSLNKYFTLNFKENNEIFEINIPIYINSKGEIKNEFLTIINNVPNPSKYSYQVDEILTLKYEDQLNNYFPILPSSLKVNINMNGFENNMFVNTKWIQSGKDTYKLVIDDSMYYDTSQKIMKKGYSNIYSTYKNMIVFPLDYYDNLGTLNLSFSPSSYTKTIFDITIPIGNYNTYRGSNNSKYYFSQSSNPFVFEDFQYQFLIPEKDFDIKKINIEDLVRWLYE